MKAILRSATLALLLAVVFSSCKNNTPGEAKYIPKDANVVFVLDLKQLQDKLQKGGISTDSLIARMFRSEPADSKDRAEFNELRTNSGIDFNQKVFLFMQQKTHPDKSIATVFSVIGTLQDGAKLEAYLKKQERTQKATIQKEKDYSYQLLDNGTMLSWNEKNVIVTHYNHQPIFAVDTVTKAYQPSTNTDAELKTQVNRYFTQKVNESLADVPVFTDMFKDKSDGYMFTSSNSSLSYLSMLPFQIPKMDELIKDNFSTTTLSFEDGKIVAKGTTYPNPMVSNLLKQYTGPQVNLAAIEKYPSASINGFMLVAFNPEMIGGLLKQLEVEGFVNAMLDKTGITSQDIYKAFKGEMSMIVSDIGMAGVEPQTKTDERSMLRKKPWGKMIAHAPVADKAAFEKIMAKAVEMGLLVKTNTGGYRGSSLVSMTGMFITADANNLVIASDSLTYSQYMSGTAKSVVNKDILDRFKGKTAAFYFDIASTLNSFSKDSISNYNNSLLSARQTFKDAIGSTNQFDGKSVKGEFEVRMQDEKQNSLVTLTRLFTDIAVDMRLKAKKDAELQDKLFPGGVPAIIRTN